MAKIVTLSRTIHAHSLPTCLEVFQVKRFMLLNLILKIHVVYFSSKPITYELFVSSNWTRHQYGIEYSVG